MGALGVGGFGPLCHNMVNAKGFFFLNVFVSSAVFT